MPLCTLCSFQFLALRSRLSGCFGCVQLALGFGGWLGSLLGSPEVASDGSLRHAEFLGNLFTWYAKCVLHLRHCFSLFKGRSLSVQRHWRDAAECSHAVDVFRRDWAAAIFAAAFSPLEPGVLLCLLHSVSVVEEHWRRVLVMWVVGRPVGHAEKFADRFVGPSSGLQA